MTRPAPWTDHENAAVITLYFAMLDKATAGEPYNKAAMIRRWQGADTTSGLDKIKARFPLANRSRGSIEAKLMNCTACLFDLDYAGLTMDNFGYRRMSNYQGALKVAMAAYLNVDMIGHPIEDKPITAQDQLLSCL